MSLVLAISNCNGIAISADRRVTQDPVGDRIALLLTDNERKLFVTKSGHAIANVGSHVLKSMKSSSSLIKDTIEQMTPDMALSDELLTLKQAFTENAFDDAYIILIGAGIDNGQQAILSMDIKDEYPTAQTNTFGYGAYYRGDDKELKNLLGLFPIDVDYYPMQESVDYIKFLNRTIAGLQRYSKHLQSISEECDVLIIDKYGTRWETAPKQL